MSELAAYLEEIEAHGYRPQDELRFAAAWDRLEAAYVGELGIASGPFVDWRERFRAGARRTVELIETHPREARFLAVEALAAGELGRRRQRALGARIAALVDTARIQLEDPDAVPPATAPWIVSVFFDRIYRWLTAGTAAQSLAAQLPELMFLAVSAYFGTEAGLAELVQRP